MCGKHTEKPNGQQEGAFIRDQEDIRKVSGEMRDVGTGLWMKSGKSDEGVGVINDVHT